MKRTVTAARLTFAGLGLLLLVAVVLWLVPSSDYLLLPDKARPVAPLVTVPKSHLRDDDKGAIYFLAVSVRKANLLEKLFPQIRSGATLVPASALRPPGVSEKTEHKIDRRDMSESQSIAAAVALRSLGYPVVAKQNGAEIAYVVPGSPAASAKLEPTQVIVSVDGHRVHTPAELRELIGKHSPGDTVQLGLRTASGLESVSVRTKNEKGRPVIGVIIDQSAHIKLPFPVKIDPGSVVGPSAGLAFALEIMEKLGRNVDRGYRVAATGELLLDGHVLPIGGVKQKAIEAGSNVDILLIPAGDNAAEARKYAGRVRVIPVQTFQQALRILATIPAKG